MSFIGTRKSVTYRLKSKGPKTDPWGTSCLTTLLFEEVLNTGNFKSTLCFLFLRFGLFRPWPRRYTEFKLRQVDNNLPSLNYDRLIIIHHNENIKWSHQYFITTNLSHIITVTECLSKQTKNKYQLSPTYLHQLILNAMAEQNTAPQGVCETSATSHICAISYYINRWQKSRERWLIQEYLLVRQVFMFTWSIS